MNPDITEHRLSHLTQFIKPCIEICISHNKKGDKEAEVLHLFKSIAIIFIFIY